MTPLLALVVVVSGGLAAIVRYAISTFTASRPDTSAFRRFPWAVLVVNAAGSALAGCAAGLAAGSALTPDVRLVLITGVAGGLTTFSTFSVETVDLLRSGRWSTAVVSCLGNLVVGLTLAVAGYVVGVLLSS
ncbi:CrcB family protein [Agreia pratensis]|uniref:Fluoride-specific ion channel FluC n=1 Tax=Agreia pratensis TaxID=150121 RepID=A0A1X7KKR9_9MICO|nr:CrcB family protein [Agreia pratensis]MBF4634621.1 CrcB family protein [Agreia pratensis]SMG41627.1 camphor resistance protein CrcB [Agreia pratensis]